MAVILAAIGDCLISFIWMFSVTTLGPLAGIIAESAGIQNQWGILAITAALITAHILIMNPICDVLGGASFNPANSAAFYVAGVNRDSMFSMALRFPAQALGAVVGLLAIREVAPPRYKGLLTGPYLKVDSHTGALAEGILGFIMTFTVLLIITKGPKNSLIQSLMLSTSTVVVIVIGSGYTGPSLNPVNAFGWAYIDDRHNTWDHFYVYWIASFAANILAAWAFRFIFLRPAAPKVKKA